MSGHRSTDRYNWAWHRWARYVAQRLVLKPVIFSNTKVTVEGERNLEGLEGPFVVVANHSSHLDAPLCITALPYAITKNLATATAADYFYGQRWRRTLTSFFFNSYPVDRNGRRSKEAGLSVSLLRQGVPLLIFPEGTRSRDGQIATFKPGAAALARALRVPLVPVALVGANEAMPVGAFWPRPGRHQVKVIIGKPVRARRGENLHDLNARLSARVRAMHTMQTSYVLVRDKDRRENRPEQFGQAREDVS
ncbi:MAG: 1-acyl-sn-glycerol-3-phosphate acyltransferase [Actinomycetales bacterium]|nr:1-acyl-sn-glycerol-3-phosphate acyltransferase [Actinomycetales bacterium]